MNVISPELTSTPIAAKAKGRTPYRFRPVFGAVCLAFALIGLFTSNGIITSAALVSLPIVLYLVWREGEPPVLAFACAFQWLQATAAIFYTNQFGVTLEEAFGDRSLTTAAWLSIASVLALGLGIRLGLAGVRNTGQNELENEARKVGIPRAFALYLGAFFVATPLERFSFVIASLTQPLLAVAALKWAAVFILCYSVLQQRRYFAYLMSCVVLEFVIGFVGIYSQFKSVFFVLAVATMCSPLALRGRRLAINLICFVTLFAMGVVWTAVKVDYRTFIAEETMEAEISPPIERKFGKLADLVESLTWDNIVDGLDGMIMRVSYVHFFALTIENVPGNVPYENGKLWGGSIVHVLTPRLFYPNKPTLDDSERTRLYAGVEVAGVEQNTSIGIGYVGESYIDFGPIGMFVPIALLGVFYGLLYRWFFINSRYKLLGGALAVSVIIFNAYEIEISNIKMMGGIVAAALAAAILYKLLGYSITQYVTTRSSPRSPPQSVPVSLSE